VISGRLCHRGRAGYLLVLVAVCVSILSISFLRLAANSGAADDDAEMEYAMCAATYAAESGLLAAELKLTGLTTPPPAGVWLVGAFPTSGTRYTVEVVPGANPKTEFGLVVKGQASGEGGRKVTSTLQAQARLELKKWQIRSRTRS
jgi:hypothetical protein